MEKASLKNEIYYHYISSNNNDVLYNIVFGYENCSKDKMQIGPSKKNVFVLHYVLSGRGELHIQDKQFALSTDDVFLIPPDIQYEYKQDLDFPWEYIWFEFSGSKAKFFCNEARLTLESPVYHCKNAIIREDLLEVLDCPDSSIALELHSLAHMYKLISQIIDERHVKMNPISKKQNTINAVQNYININLSDSNLGLKKISDAIYMNASYLSRIFKEVTGVNLNKHINRMRVQKAIELLLEKTYSIKDITFMVGYKDPHYFSSIFKKYISANPSKFKDLGALSKNIDKDIFDKIESDLLNEDLEE